MAVAPKSASPRYAMVVGSLAALRALSAVAEASHPAGPTASSSEAYLIVQSPTVAPASAIASFWPLTSARIRAANGPRSGRLE